MLGAAIGLKAAMETGELCGKVVFIASPAEEGIELEYRKSLIEQGKIQYIAGKPQLISEGVLDDVDIAYMQHLSSRYGFNDHNGSVCKKIIFKGKSCHASRPQAGINALNGMNLALHALGLLRESYSNSDKIRFHGIVSEGGQSVNVIPDHVVMEYMLRAETVEALVGLNKRFDNAVLHAGLAAECEVEIQTVHYSMPLYDDLDLGKVHQDVVAQIAPGESFDFNSTFFASCTDMGDIGTVLPAIHGYVPGMTGTSHGKDYYVADYNTPIITGSRINARMAIELLADDAAIGKKIAAKKAALMPIKEYLSVIKSLSSTVQGKI
jgi:amidohydrolase